MCAASTTCERVPFSPKAVMEKRDPHVPALTPSVYKLLEIRKFKCPFIVNNAKVEQEVRRFTTILPLMKSYKIQSTRGRVLYLLLRVLSKNSRVRRHA